MHMQKHAYGVWSTDPGAAPVTDPAPYVPAAEPVAIVGSPEGAATVATYSVLHGRDGEPERALLICDLPEGGRCYALLDGGPAALAGAEDDELIGRRVTLTPKDQVNWADWPERVVAGLVGGIDGCRAGWVLATVPAHGAVAPGWCRNPGRRRPRRGRRRARVGPDGRGGHRHPDRPGGGRVAGLRP